MRKHLLFREVNLRIHELTGPEGVMSGWRETLGEAVDYACECADLGCTAPVPLTRDKSAEIVENPDYYVVAPGHYPGYAEIIERELDYAVVMIRGDARVPARVP